MAAVSEIIAREYFELHGFLVRQHQKHIVQSRHEEEEDIGFFIFNPRTKTRSDPLPFVIASADLPGIHRAIVVVKGWHTETFSPARLAASPEIFRVAEPAVFHQAARAFGNNGMPLKILVVPALPNGAQAREESVALLRSKGIDAVILFRTMLADLVRETRINRNYQKSDLLQIIRILKKYDFFKEPQLELFKGHRKGR